MRPQSIIGLIVAALMVVGGLVLCLIAGNMAESTGVQLFTKVENGTTQFVEKEFTKSKITKIEINVRDADVNIIGGQETSYVEFLNYDDKYYNYSESGKTVTVSELKDFDSIVKFWENGFVFKGVRNVLSSLLGLGEQITGKKTINIYLSDESDELNNLELIMESGNVTIKNIALKMDYVVNMTSGSLNVTGVTNSSKLELVAAGEVSVSLVNDSFSTLLINSAADNNDPLSVGHLLIRNTCLGASDIVLTDGDVTVDGLPGANSLESWILNVTTSEGAVSYNGKSQGQSYKYVGRFAEGATAHYVLTIVADKADVTIYHPQKSS